MSTFRNTLIGAVAGGALLLAPATAAADPTDIFDPILNSSCTFDQVDAALHNVAPDVAAQLDAMPDRKGRLRALFDVPIEQRQMTVDGYLAANPDLSVRAEQLSNSPQADQARSIVQSVANTCNSY